MPFAQEHTGSYYAATANSDVRWSRLKGEQRADVCVVGGGFTGVSAALTLAERDYSVVLLEANRVGWGASGRNGGQVIGGISGEDRIVEKDPGLKELVWHMRWAGHEIICQRIETYGIDCDFKFGYADVAIKPRHVRHLEEIEAELASRAYPYEHRLLSTAETRDALGTDAYIGAHVNMGNGHLHPLNLCLGEARAAESKGVKIFEQSAVLEIQEGEPARVMTAEGSVTADFVIVAGNAYQEFERSLRSRIFPVRSYIIATEPLTEDELDVINPHDLAICDPNYVLTYYRLSADKRMLFGGRLNYFGEDSQTISKSLKPRMAKLYPQLREKKIAYAWGGTIAVPINRIPQLGRRSPNVLYAMGYSGHGVNVTHLAGEVLADVIGGTAERFDVFERMRSPRIPGVTRFGNAMVALGVMYYGLKDRL